MIIETYGGICPVCKFDRMMMRYGSHSWWQFDACPRCGFAYGSDGHKEDTDPMEVWKVILSANEMYLRKVLKLPVTIDGILEWHERLPKPSSNERKQVFQYTEKDIAEYKQSKLYKRRSVKIPVKVVFT